MKKIIYIVFICLLLVGCSGGKINKKEFYKFVPKKTEQLATDCFKLIKEKKLEQVSNLFISKYRTQQTINALNKISGFMNTGTLKSQELIGWNVVKWKGNIKNEYSKKTVLEYQQDLSGTWLLLTITVYDDKFIAGINAIPLSRPLQEINAFNFSRKPFLQIVFLILAILVPLFSLFTLVVCFMTKLKKRKWLWIIFIVLGFGKFSMNWTSGIVFWNSICIQLLSSSFVRQGLYSPWFISVSVPLGAILFWAFKKKITQPSDVGAVEHQAPSDKNN